MEQYDYRENENMAAAVDSELELLTPGQRVKIWESIQDVKRSCEAEQLLRGRRWFEQAVLPALRGFARAASSLLEIDWDADGSITAALRCREDIEIPFNCRGMRLAMFAAENILISCDDGEIQLVLTYDCGTMMSSS